MVDVLFVVDASGSMVEEQDAVGAAFPAMAEALATGDLDGDGRLDFPPVEDLHVGVITADLGLLVSGGLGGVRPYRCSAGGEHGGDDGLLLGASRADDCDAALDGYFLQHREGEPVGPFARRFGCLARVGTDGCGTEQPLEAALKALTPATSGLRFAGGAPGHGDGLNAGFVRSGSVLAAVVLTDEDDGSLADASYLEVETEEELVLGDAWLHPIERYAEWFAALREGSPERFVVAAVAGVPVDLAPESASSPVDYDAILADPRMALRYDPSEEGIGLIPSCVAPGLGRATPPRRLVSLAARLGDRAVVQSICQPDLRPALTVITERIGEVVRETWCVDGEAEE